MKPLSLPRCLVVPCLVLFATATAVPAATTPADSAPASLAPAPATESGWMSRLTATPGKLAFWKKESPPDPAPAAATSPVSRSTKTAEARKTAGPTDPAPKIEKQIPESVPPPGKQSKPAKKLPAEPSATVEEAKKPGFLGRLWGADKKEAAPSEARPPEKSAVAEAEARTKERLGPAKPEAQKKIAGTTSKPVPAPLDPATAASGKKPSIWSRMASAVVPGKPTTPAPSTAPPAPTRGSHQPVAAELTNSTFVITKDESPFYTFGPHQATAPDAYLSTGTVVTMQEKSWGWAQVHLTDGRSGTVARNALRPATAADLLPASSPPSLMAAANTRRGGSADSYVMPPAAMPDLPTGPAGPSSAAEADELSSALLPPFAE